ncbi:hypothetical protein CEUSTIGMA_g11545.t1 [Chlamydomonas eustigma]|uniref:Uncharacterized protein n=1 Tax=Chlamydomonas eustigma TaxID=1157962 RepID=A0A250XMJ7_9CHLO|nr:hypothetical protein CEUSTIGMA_g11545.t1 [Chlamydomonas eustigma]|eukprot:GAX84122.1 hypothetical protein CEUSTIGMA_g11545.t1 [Chlamydomonas eustigma]
MPRPQQLSAAGSDYGDKARTCGHESFLSGCSQHASICTEKQRDVGWSIKEISCGGPANTVGSLAQCNNTTTLGRASIEQLQPKTIAGEPEELTHVLVVPAASILMQDEDFPDEECYLAVNNGKKFESRGCNS